MMGKDHWIVFREDQVLPYAVCNTEATRLSLTHVRKCVTCKRCLRILKSRKKRKD